MSFFFCSIKLSHGLDIDNTVHSVKLSGKLIMSFLSEALIISKPFKKIITLIYPLNSLMHL